jgi:hypothetical protein
MSALFISAREEWIATGVNPDQGYRIYNTTIQLRPARDSAEATWLVEAKLSVPFPDQKCRIAWTHAASLGVDLEPHYATDAEGKKFLPGTAWDTTIAPGAPDAEQESLAQAARLAGSLRAWLAAVNGAIDAAEGDPAKIVWPPPSAELQGFACRIEPNTVLDEWKKRHAQRQADDAERQRAQWEKEADPIYMPHNIG